MSRLKEIGVVAALVAISAVPRFADLGRFTSIDEPFWLRQSGNFYYALGQREFQNTLYEYHPAVTTMWIISGGMLLYFPEYRAMEQGYLKPGRFDEFLIDNGKSLLELLVTSRAIQVAVIVCLVAIVYALLRRLFDLRTALFATSFLSLSPFLIGQSRLLNHEALVGLFSLVSLLGVLTYLHRGRQLSVLLLSAVAAGLAQLTKSSALPIIAIVALLLIVHAIRGRDQAGPAGPRAAAKTLGLWMALMAATYVMVWPGMWVAPLAMLQDVYGNALSYALEGTRSGMLPDVQASGFNFQSMLGGIGLYLNDLLWRTTPLTGLGAVVAVALVLRHATDEKAVAFRWLVLYAALLAAAFVLLFGIQRSPKPPHYILTSYVALDLVAGIALVRGWDALTTAVSGLRGHYRTALALAVLLAMQMASVASAYPYYISYYNPVVEAIQPGIQNPTLNENGYGMGLDQAARYLAAKPAAKDMVVLSSHGLGSFSYYFPGRTVAMNDFRMSDPQIGAIMPGIDYVVVDYYNHKRKGIKQDLDGAQPEKSIWLNGIEFLRIYPSSAFPPTYP
jgi:hypothetical protein